MWKLHFSFGQVGALFSQLSRCLVSWKGAYDGDSLWPIRLEMTKREMPVFFPKRSTQKTGNERKGEETIKKSESKSNCIENLRTAESSVSRHWVPEIVWSRDHYPFFIFLFGKKEKENWNRKRNDQVEKKHDCFQSWVLKVSWLWSSPRLNKAKV